MLLSQLPSGLEDAEALVKRQKAAAVKKELWRALYRDAYLYAMPARETWTWEGKPADPAHISRVRDSMRCSVASRLMLGCRAAITAGLVHESAAGK